jgi:hypothetical protein
MAAKKVGGPRKLRDYLHASAAAVVSWLAGAEEPPTPVFLRALELILDGLDDSERNTSMPKNEGETP